MDEALHDPLVQRHLDVGIAVILFYADNLRAAAEHPVRQCQDQPRCHIGHHRNGKLTLLLYTDFDDRHAVVLMERIDILIVTALTQLDHGDIRHRPVDTVDLRGQNTRVVFKNTAQEFEPLLRELARTVEVILAVLLIRVKPAVRCLRCLIRRAGCRRCVRRGFLH